MAKLHGHVINRAQPVMFGEMIHAEFSLGRIDHAPAEIPILAGPNEFVVAIVFLYHTRRESLIASNRRTSFLT